MHIVFVQFHYNSEDCLNEFTDKQKSDANLIINLVQRCNKNSIKNHIHYIKDEYNDALKWWQNPEKVNNYIAQLNPDLVYIFGLNLPLHFRWLKHYIPDTTILIGQYCGEEIWIQKNLWLQQFGLRVVDGFVFDKKENAKPWIKCAAILDSQPVFETDYFNKNKKKVYSDLIVNHKSL